MNISIPTKISCRECGNDLEHYIIFRDGDNITFEPHLHIEIKPCEICIKTFICKSCGDEYNTK